MTKERREIWICVALALLIAVVYGRVAQHEFINYDDPDYVLTNPIVQQGLTAKALAWAFGRLHGEHTYWHPLTWVSHMLDIELFGLNAGAHHLMNVMFHALNSILLFLLFRRMTGALWQSALVAGLFALHPLQVDTVAWVAERKNLLSTLFWILTTMAYLRFAREGKWTSYGLTLVLFALGLMCKPVLVTLPFVLLLLDYWPLNRWPLGAKQMPPNGPYRQSSGLRLVVEKAPFLVLSAIASGITVAAHQGLGMKQVMHGLSLGLRIENAIVSYTRYLAKIVWPDNLSIIYPHPGVWPRVTVYFSAAVLAVITIAVVGNIRRRPYLAVGWCWFLGVLVPAIGIVQVGIQAMADRFAYIPVIGIFAGFVWLGAEWAAANGAKRWIPKVATALILGACAVTTWVQLGHWRNSETVLTHAANVTVRNFMAHLNLAVLNMDRGQTNKVAYHATEALRGNPNVHEALVLLGYTREAEKDFAGAVSNYHRALSIAPHSYPARKALATVLAAQGDYANAEAELLKLAKANPTDADVHDSLAGVYLKQRKPEGALAHYRTALDLNPASPSVLNNAAWLLATSPDPKVRNGQEAVRYAERACELTQRSVPVLLGTLAAAYAEAGRFEDAVQAAEEARDLAQKMGNTQIAETNSKLLQLYRAKTAYREGQEAL